mmetsp:Transcript_2966/g.4478  ORF Transcript_2966/g.4478 Transcript_2966/m.4478 type:complete len:95 (-) Transcript_2966:184-468(-)
MPEEDIYMPRVSSFPQLPIVAFTNSISVGKSLRILICSLSDLLQDYIVHQVVAGGVTANGVLETPNAFATMTKLKAAIVTTTTWYSLMKNQRKK